MDEPPPSPDTASPAWPRHPAVRAGAEATAFAMVATAAVGLAIYGGRREIGRELATNWLRERGVESGFVIESVDSGAFVGRVRLGPVRDPIFSAERMEVTYDLTPPWSGSPFRLNTTAVRLVRPRLKASWDGERFSAGPLDPLVRDFLGRPSSGEPGPAVLVEDALATVTTPSGPVRVSGDAALDDNQLLRFDGRLLATELRGPRFAASSPGGTISLRKAGPSLTADLRLAGDYSGDGLDLEGAEAAIEGALPYPDIKRGTLSGPLTLRAAVRAGRLGVGETSTVALESNFRLAGTASGEFSRPALTGRLTGSARAQALSAAGVQAREARADLDVTGLSLMRDASGVGLKGAARLNVRAGRAAAGRVFVSDTVLSASAPGLVLTTGEGGATVASPFSATLETGRATVGDFVLTGARAVAAGRLQAGDAFILTAEGDLRADGSVARAREMADGLPVVSQDPAQAAAIAAALRDFTVHAPRVRLAMDGGGTRIALGAAAVLSSPSGGRITVSPRGGSLYADQGGAFDLAVDGGGLPRIEAAVASWTMVGGGLDARLALKAALDAPPAQDATIAADGRLRMAGGATTFTLARCSEVSARRVEFGEIAAADAGARLCPSGRPLVEAGGGTWRVAGRFERGMAGLPTAQAAASGAAGTFEIGGHGEMDRALVRLDSAQVTDAQAQARFNPIRAGGRLELAGGVWRGVFPVTGGTGRPIAIATLRHEAAGGRGEAVIDASGLAFSAGGLQPADLSPLAGFARNAEGAAAFTGRFAWTPDGSTSSGELSVPRLTFASPAGMVTGLSTRIAFTSLAPLATAPDQTLAIEQVDAIVALDHVAATFDLADEALSVDSLTAGAARGQVSLEPAVFPLGAGRTLGGTLVLDDVDVGELVAASTLAEKVKVQAVVDGRLPFAFGPEGLRFADGHVAATGPGRIAIDRTALSDVQAQGGATANPMDAAPASGEVNAIQDFAYQAMENLAFEDLEATVNSTPGGRLAMLFRIKGRHDPAVAEQATVGLRELLSGQAFKRRIPLPKGTPVDLTLDTSLNFDELLQAWRRQWAEAPDTEPPHSEAVQP